MNPDKRFWLALLLFVVIITLICFFPYWFTTRSWFGIDFRSTGQIGDTIGGIMQPFIALAVGLLTFFAFWVQYQANVTQTRQFKKQDVDTKIERFENKFYEMIKIHRDNVSDMNIEDNIRGRKAFTSFYYEFKYIYFKLKRNYNSSRKKEKNLRNEKKELTNMAYLLFFYGVGFNSSKVLIELFRSYDDKSFLQQTIKELEDERLQYLPFKEEKRPLVVKVDDDKATYRVKFQPFSGHAGKLGHYFRHLFQTIKYVDQQDDTIIENKYSYVKTLRAQLSNFEQLLLYYNSISVLGDEWIKKGYMTKFQMIKNIPLPFANFGLTPNEQFKDEIRMGKILFEWDEIQRKI